jgi:hypothetical protein
MIIGLYLKGFLTGWHPTQLILSLATNFEVVQNPKEPTNRIDLPIKGNMRLFHEESRL